MKICDKRLANAKPLSSFDPGDVVTACGEYYMVTNGTSTIQVPEGYRICVNVESGTIAMFNDEYLVAFAPSEVYVE